MHALRNLKYLRTSSNNVLHQHERNLLNPIFQSKKLRYYSNYNSLLSSSLFRSNISHRLFTSTSALNENVSSNHKISFEHESLENIFKITNATDETLKNRLKNSLERNDSRDRFNKTMEYLTNDGSNIKAVRKYI